MTEFTPLTTHESLAPALLDEVLGRARERVRELPTAHGNAGTTVAAVAVSHLSGAAHWLTMNVGDSRIYRLRDGELEQLSTDHSEVQELIDAGLLDREEAASDRRRNVITRAIGAGSDGVPDFRLLPAAVGDRLLVCSDGLHGEVSNSAIAAILREQPDPREAATRLVHEALLHGGRDNITVIVVDALAIADPSEIDQAGASDDSDEFGDLDDTRPTRVPGAVRG